MNDDAERIQELADDDEAAKALIYRKFYRSVFLEASRILENYEEAEEITDDAFVKAFKRRSRGEPGETGAKLVEHRCQPF